MKAPSTRNHFRGEIPFKVQVNFDIHLSEGQIYADALERWLNLLEGYFSIHNFSNNENITFVLLKDLPYVKYWWETYCEQHVEDKFTIFWLGPTWVDFVDALKEHYYLVGNYEDQYMRWTTLRKKKGQAVP